MLSEWRASAKFDLPEELLEVLPSDPFQQLNVARKITSIALSTRVSALESETPALHQQLTDRDAIISGLQSQLDASLRETADKLAAARQEKESLFRENAQLSFTVKKLNRDVAKLETFRQNLMKSLQEDEDNPEHAPQVATPHVPSTSEDDAMSPPTRTTTSVRTQFSDAGSSYYEDDESEATKTRVDGKEFFRQVRNRLSYAQFEVFLANVKEFNSHKQTKEETLGKAYEVFEEDNKDLYVIFEGLITQNISNTCSNI